MGEIELAIDHDPLAVRDKMRLGRLADAIARFAQDGRHELLRAALAVGAANQSAAQLLVRITKPGQEGAGAIESKSDPEPSARLQPAENLSVARIGVFLAVTICSAVGLRPLLRATGDEAPRVAGLRPSLAAQMSSSSS